MVSERQGWLALGLGASVALHAVAVLWLARSPAPVSPVVSSPGGGAEELVEIQVVPVVASASHEPAPVVSRSHPRSAAPPADAPSQERGTEAAAGGGATAPAAPIVAASEAGDSAGAGSSTGSAAPTDGPEGVAGSGAGNARSTALLVARLSAAALRCYPPEAVRFHLAGEAVLSFCLTDSGEATAVRLTRSSGSDALDRAASGCVLPGALPLPGAAGCYELPVRFAVRGR